MRDEDGRYYVIEINSAPSLPNLTNGDFSYRQRMMAKAFDWMVREEEVPPVLDEPNWRSYIHPAIWPRRDEDA